MWADPCVVKEVGNVAAVVSLVVHVTKQHFTSGHSTNAPVHEAELHDFVMRCHAELSA